MFALLTLAACTPGPTPLALELSAPAEWQEALGEHLGSTPLAVEWAERPRGRAGRRWGVEVRQDLDCVECYAVEGEGEQLVVHAGDLLGAQYGLSALLEEGGFRFLHPFHTVVPAALPSLGPLPNEVVHPAIAERGLHLHTLHPIEALEAFWLPGEENEARAVQVLDWVIHNRGNYVQWVALDDIEESSGQAAEWTEHTRRVNEAAHLRGLRTGVGIQLFGSSNLQRAFDLLDDVGSLEENRAAMGPRLALVTGDVGFDHLSLSFGEFSGVDPETFIENVDLAYEVAQELQPGVTMSSTIHVGDDQQVEYKGETMVYYFLAQYADPAIVPWVHSVMYYNLFEDAGGAYHHEEFTEHREFLLERLAAGEPVGYHPESAYWVAFDNPVPTYTPLYIRSRAHDLEQIAAAGPLPPSHVLFSSGWEWGYWQNDVATLRLCHTPQDWRGLVEDWYAPWGDDGAKLAAAVEAVADLEHGALIEQRLAGYIAGRDAIMDAGYALGIVSQPERLTFDDVVALDAGGRAAFRAGVVEPLAAFADGLEGIEAELAGVAEGSADPWVAEVWDGLQITRMRARYAALLWGAVVDHADGVARFDGGPAQAVQAEAATVVARRRAAFHDPEGQRWIAPEWDNPTVYDYGYLIRADELCFWERERVQALDATVGTEESAPGCAL